MTTTALWWIRRDFRLIDNQALSAAANAADGVFPIFIEDPLLTPRQGSFKQQYLRGALRGLGEAIQQQGGKLLIRRGNPTAVLSELSAQTGAKEIFAEADTTPYARERDTEIASALSLHLTAGLTAIPPEVVRKADGGPYTVFTPFSKAWKSLPAPAAGFQPEAVRWAEDESLFSLPLPEETAIPPDQMLAQLTEFANERIYAYHENRDRMDLEGTSRLSAAFHLGLISAAQAVSLARRSIARAASPEARKGAETWLNELIWREFYQSILYHFPFVRRQAFREPYRAIQWIDDPDGFATWQQGLTGYPIVDAAMRQLNTTGWMHNRARMIAASFLVKDLLIDWQWGETYFMQQLVDGDVASNNGGWQWTAGVGTDAAPYFRIFNPILQSKKFDPHGDYIRKYVPELSDVPEEFIHEPWKMTPLEQQAYRVQLGSTYPQPIIDHAFVRERTLAAYGAVK